MLAGAGKATLVFGDILPFDGFDGVLHPLYVRVLVVEAQNSVQARSRVCLVSVEATSLKQSAVTSLRSMAARIAQCGIESVWVCVTHTFSAPHIRTPEHLISQEDGEKNDRLIQTCKIAVKKAVIQAVGSMQKARFSWGIAPAEINVNRDIKTPAGWWLGTDPKGYSNHEVRVLTVIAQKSDRPLAILFSADVQSSVLDHSVTSEGKHLVSGDLAGFAASAIEHIYADSVALFLVGCAGDQAPLKKAVVQKVDTNGYITSIDIHEEAYKAMQQLGNILACAVQRVVRQGMPFKVETVWTESHTLILPGQQKIDFDALGPTECMTFESSDSRVTEIFYMRLGEMVLLGIQPEISSALGKKIRDACDKRSLLIVTMVNGAQKYLPDADAYEKITYEAMNSYFAQGSDELLVQDTIKTIMRNA